MTLSTKLQRNWISLWSLELNAIALSRISLGLLLIVDLLTRLSYAEMFYAVNGLAPPHLVRGSFPAIWNLYLLTDHLWLTKALISLNLIAALCWTLGYRAKLALFISWFLYASVFYRNSFIHSGAEVTLLVALFWMMWLPHSRVWSVDAIRTPHTPSTRVCSAGSVAYISAVVVYYFFSGLNKSGAVWWPEGSALYYALSLDNLVSSMGLWLRDFSAVTQLITWLIWWFEVLSPLFLIALPLVFGQKARTAALAVLIVLHIGIALFLSIGNFPYINLAILLALLPLSGSSNVTQVARPVWSSAQTLLLCVGLGLVVSQIVYATYRVQHIKPPKPLKRFLQTVAILNEYNFYSPRPPVKERFWYFSGTLADGRIVDPYHLVLQPPLADKEDVLALWNRYHLKYFEHMSKRGERALALQKQMARYLCVKWQQQPSLPSIESVTLHFHQEWTADWGSAKPDFRYTSVGKTHICPKT